MIVTTILLGIAASVFTEVVTAINKILSGTVLKGDGAFLLAFGMAFIAALIKEMMLPGFYFGELLNFAQLGAFFAETFTVSQVFFLVIYARLGLNMQDDGTVKGPAAPVEIVTSTTTV